MKRMFDENSFDIELNIDKNILRCKIVFNQAFNEEVEYAFYLLLDKKRIDTKYYTKADNAEFNLSASGKYSIVGFVKYAEKKIIKTSDEIKFEFKPEFTDSIKKEGKKTPVSIFGSCVTRDILEFDKNKNFSLQTYIARQSVISAVSQAVSIDINEIKLASNFKKETVYHDFIKDTFERLKNDESEYLFIDLIDERFGLLMYENSFVTYSAELQESGYIKDLRLISKRIRYSFGRKDFYLDRIKADRYLDEFCSRILEIYKPESIIIHRAKMCNYYIDKKGEIKRFPLNHLRSNKNVNEFLEYMYDYMQYKLDGCTVIDIMDEFCADEGQKWGLAPMHYQKEYYEKMISELTKAVLNR